MPKLLVLVPARNAGKTLKDTLMSIEKSTVPKGYERRIVVCANGCRDNTAEVARRSKVPSLEVVELRRPNKNAAINHVVHKRGSPEDVVVLVNADATVDGESMLHLVKGLETAKLVGGQILFRNEGRFGRLTKGLPVNSLPSGALMAFRANDLPTLPEKHVYDDAYLNAYFGQRFGRESVRVVQEATAHREHPGSAAGILRRTYGRGINNAAIRDMFGEGALNEWNLKRPKTPKGLRFMGAPIRALGGLHYKMARRR